MTNLKLRNLSNFRLQAGIVIFAALAPLIWAQASRQLQVEVGTNQLVSILARGVSYGEVLKALQKKLGWEIEIPPVADELQLSYVRVEASRPQIALTKLLEGSRELKIKLVAWLLTKSLKRCGNQAPVPRTAPE